MIDDLSVICTAVYDELSQNYVKQISPVQPQPGVNKWKPPPPPLFYE